MSKAKGHYEKADEVTYIIYDSKSGRILGTYSHYDAERDARVKCNPEEVMGAIEGAAPELSAQSDIKILEIKAREDADLKDVKVNIKTKRLVGRKSLRSQTKEWPPK